MCYQWCFNKYSEGVSTLKRLIGTDNIFFKVRLVFPYFISSLLFFVSKCMDIKIKTVPVNNVYSHLHLDYYTFYTSDDIKEQKKTKKTTKKNPLY